MLYNLMTSAFYTEKVNVISVYLFMVFTVLLILLPLTFYKSQGEKSFNFFIRVAYSPHGPKLFSYMLMLIVISFHLNYYAVFPKEIGIMFSTIIMFYLLSSKRTIALLARIRKNKKWMTGTFLLTLAIAFIPHGLSVSITLAYILIAACHYAGPHTQLYGGENSLARTNFVESYFR